MKQQEFESRYEPQWRELRSILDNKNDAENEHLPGLYRLACHHLATAKSRRYSNDLVTYLNNLVLDGHNQVYQHRARFQNRFLYFIVRAFPDALKANYRFVWAALLLFYLPLVAMGALCFLKEDIIYSVMAPEQVRSFEAMYDPDTRVLGRERESDTDLYMFGFYIKNNIGIAFRTFAAGILLGTGSVFFLIYNGVIIGSLMGYVTRLGFISTFYGFVAGHSAFELTAIAISGAAGLKLGYAILAPGAYPRSVAIRKAGTDSVILMYGVTLMLTIAAFLEAFWSSSTSLSTELKYAVGCFFWLLVILYCSSGKVRVADGPE